MKSLFFIPLVAFWGLLAASGLAQNATIQVDASQVLNKVSPYLTGACLEDVNHEVYGGIYSQMIFGESFQEPAASMSLVGFTNYGGNWQIQGTNLWAQGGTGPKIIYQGADVTTGDASVDVFFANNTGNAGFIVKVSQPGIGADVFNGYEISLSPAGNLVLGRHRQNWEPINQVTCAVPLNQWINLKVSMNGAALQIFVNGASVLQYTDTTYPLTDGQIGLRTWNQDAVFRNLTITTNGVIQNIAFQSANIFGKGLSSMWGAINQGTATGQFSLETSGAFAGTQSQRMTFASGAGEIGMENRGLNRWGLFVAGGMAYEGCLWAHADTPTTLTLALESGDGSIVLAQQDVTVTSNDWQRLNFQLTPATTNSGARFSIKLKQPGSVVVGASQFLNG